MLKAVVSLALLCSALAPPLATAQTAGPSGSSKEVPARFRGTWGKAGRCDVIADRLAITATSARFGNDAARPVGYMAGDQVLGFGEYDSDLIEMGGRPNILINHTQGLHTSVGNENYLKCGPQMQRETWPVTER